MQYTRCASRADYEKHSPANWDQGAFLPLLLNALKQGAIFGTLGAVIGAALTFSLSPAVGAFALGLIFFNYAFADGFCDQWLNWRLICIQPNACAMGSVAFIETVDKKFEHDIGLEYLFDNDLSFNMRLMPFNGKYENGKFEFEKDDFKRPEYNHDAIHGTSYRAAQLLDAAPNVLGSNYHYEGYDGSAKPNHPGGRWTMHCEIEGDAMQRLCTSAKTIALLGPVAQVLGALAGGIFLGVVAASRAYDAVHSGCRKVCPIPLLCDVVCFIAAALASVAAFVVAFIVGALVLFVVPGLAPLAFGAVAGLAGRNDGRYSDVQNDPDSGAIHEGDCVLVSGQQVYDAGHAEGWSELHPVMHMQTMCAVEDMVGTEDCCHGMLTTKTDVFNTPAHVSFINDLWDRWCDAVSNGYRLDVTEEQQRPVHSWSYHPLVDGCAAALAQSGPVVK